MQSIFSATQDIICTSMQQLWQLQTGTAPPILTNPGRKANKQTIDQRNVKDSYAQHSMAINDNDF